MSTRHAIGAVLLGLVVLLWSSFGYASGRARIEAQLTPNVARLGQLLVLEVVVRHPSGSSVVWPENLEFGASIEERAREVLLSSRVGEGEETRMRATLAVFAADVREVPSLRIRVEHSDGTHQVLETLPSQVTVQSTVNQSDPKLMASTGPRDALVRDWRLAVCAVAALLVLLGAIMWVARRRSVAAPMGEIPSVPLSAHAAALAALDALDARLGDSDVKPVFHEMSEIVREYLGRRFGFEALDKTSSELRSRIHSAPGSHEWGDAMNAWLTRCDLVKYAGASASIDDARLALHGARVLVERTKESALAQERPAKVTRA